jgi:hypothetical protein
MRPCGVSSTRYPLCNYRQQHDEGGVMRPTINPEKKNGRTRTAAKEKSVMERYVALKAADFKAGVAIPIHSGDGDGNLTRPHH